AASASSSEIQMRTSSGTERLPQKGAPVIRPAVRPKTSMKVTTSGQRCAISVDSSLIKIAAGSTDHRRQAENNLARERHVHLQHPGAEKNQREHRRQHFGHKHQSEVVDLGGRLKNAHGNAGDEAEQNRRSSHRAADLQCAAQYIDQRFRGHAKLLSKEPTSRFQPSTSTNKTSLNGSDTSTGGKNIMPIDIRIDATTRSSTRNGT